MALTDMDRHLLIEARKRIYDKKDSFICCALGWVAAYELGKDYVSASYDQSRVGKSCRKLQRYLYKKLGKYATLNDWQKSRGIVLNYDEVRKSRLQWIDWMLGE
jgi:hypothetical protein